MQHPRAAPRVLVTDAEERSVVAAIRSLHAGGFRVAGAATTRPAAGHWSRSCSERLLLADPRADGERFSDELEQALRGSRYDVLLPGTDASLLAISTNRARLEPHVRIGLPPPDVVRRSFDKLLLVEAAAQTGLRPPTTIECDGYEEAAPAARRLGFPVVIKARYPVVELDGTIKQWPSSRRVVDEPALARTLPQYGGHCLIQEIDRGDLFSCSGVMADGGLLAFATSRYRRTWPPEAGSVAFGETISPPPELEAKTRDLLAAVGWEGIFELELIRGEDQAFAAIDLNPRPFGSMALIAAAGAPLAAIWCDWLLGRGHERVTARAGVRYRWEDADLRHMLWQLRRRNFRAAAAVIRPYRRVVHSHFELTDPGPLVAQAWQLAARKLRGARPHGA